MITAEVIDYIFENEFTLDDFLSSTPFLVTLVNKNGYFVEFNDLWCDILGYSKSQIKRTNFFDLIHPNDLEKSKVQFENGELFSKESKATYGFKNRYRTKRGDYAKLEWFSTGTLIKGNSLAYAIFRGYE